jgi:hypothetical protein
LRSFAGEQCAPSFDAPGIPRNDPVGANDAVARDGDRQLIGRAGTRDRTHRFGRTDPPRDFAICNCGADGNLLKSLPHPLLESGTSDPFHLLWDGATATDEGQQKLPIGDGTARKVAMKYPSEGGYQPGDTWDLYVGTDKRIEEIAYHRGAANPPHLVTAKYADYKKAGPLLISTDHPGMVDGKSFRITITDVSVKLTGSDKWTDAQ